MKKLHSMYVGLVLLALTTLNSQLATAQAQGTAFLYNGGLNFNGAAANGSYDLTFTLFDASSSGNNLGTVTQTAVPVSNGLFSVTLNYGPVFTGSNYWLALAARTNGGATFTNLAPRQPVLPVPYAMYAASVAASNIIGTLSASQIAGGTISNTTLANISSESVTNLTIAGNETNLGNEYVSGIIYGNGAGITNLNASSITSGTISNISFTNIPQANVTNLVINNGICALIGGITNNALGFFGNGAGLTNLSASQITSGTISNSALANIPSENVTNLTVNGNLTNAGSEYVSGTIYGNGAGITNMPIEQLKQDTNFSFNNASFNWFMGQSAGNLSSTGVHLVAYGGSSMSNIVTGNNNSAFGFESLAAAGGASLTGIGNTALGNFALGDLTNGYHNVAVGVDAMFFLASGGTNIAIGYGAGEGANNLLFATNSIYIGNPGNNGDNGQIYIGKAGTHTNAFIAGNLTNNGYLSIANGVGSYANSVNTSYNPGTQGTTNTSTVNEYFKVSFSSSTYVEYNNAGTPYSTNASYSGIDMIILQPHGFWTNSGTCTILGERAW